MRGAPSGSKAVRLNKRVLTMRRSVCESLHLTFLVDPSWMDPSWMLGGSLVDPSWWIIGGSFLDARWILGGSSEDSPGSLGGSLFGFLLFWAFYFWDFYFLGFLLSGISTFGIFYCLRDSQAAPVSSLTDLELIVPDLGIEAPDLRYQGASTSMWCY